MAQSGIIEKYTDDFVKALKKLLDDDKSIDIKQIAEVMGITVSAISNYVHKRNNIRKSTLQKFVNYYRIESIKGFSPQEPAAPANGEFTPNTREDPAPFIKGTAGGNPFEQVSINNPPQMSPAERVILEKLDLLETNLKMLATNQTASTDALLTLLAKLDAGNPTK